MAWSKEISPWLLGRPGTSSPKRTLVRTTPQEPFIAQAALDVEKAQGLIHEITLRGSPYKPVSSRAALPVESRSPSGTSPQTLSTKTWDRTSPKSVLTRSQESQQESCMQLPVRPRSGLPVKPVCNFTVLTSHGAPARSIISQLAAMLFICFTWYLNDDLLPCKGVTSMYMTRTTIETMIR